jgi:DUF4097 and DUF4098 domain-containing protein YvlB
MHTFQTPDPPTLVVRAGAGSVTITAEDTDLTSVRLSPAGSAGEEAVAQAVVEQRGDAVVVLLPRSRGLFRQGVPVDVDVTCPTGTRLEVTGESADLRATGTYAEATLSSGSGEVLVDTVTGTARLTTGSGSVTAGQVDETLVVATGSGDVEVDHSGRTATLTAGSGDISIGQLVGEVVAKTGSGDVEVGILGGSLSTKTGSGDLTVRRAASGSVQANGASGSVTIGIQEGTAAWLDLSTLSGRVRQELGETDAPREDQQRVQITAHTVSGDLRVHRS